MRSVVLSSGGTPGKSTRGGARERSYESAPPAPMERVPMSRFRLLPLLLLALACKSTRENEETVDQVTISGDDLEPLNTFVLETKRLVVADFVRIECSAQYFQERMGFTRDFRYVERTQRVDPDGTVLIGLKNVLRDQETNIDPMLLPRVYFGNGLEIRAYREIRVVFRRKVTRQRPVFLEIDARSAGNLARMWVSGRPEMEQQGIKVVTQLLYDKQFDRYRHSASIG